MSNFHNLWEIKFEGTHGCKTIVLDRMVWLFWLWHAWGVHCECWENFHTLGQSKKIMYSRSECAISNSGKTVYVSAYHKILPSRFCDKPRYVCFA